MHDCTLFCFPLHFRLTLSVGPRATGGDGKSEVDDEEEGAAGVMAVMALLPTVPLVVVVKESSAEGADINGCGAGVVAGSGGAHFSTSILLLLPSLIPPLPLLPLLLLPPLPPLLLAPATVIALVLPLALLAVALAPLPLVLHVVLLVALLVAVVAVVVELLLLL